MSSSLALVISCSSAASGSAPGRSYKMTPSRMIISVGMDEIPNAAASSCSASVSTLPNTAELITGLIGVRTDHEVLATDPWTARMLIADRFADRRVFLVGESAHVNPPFGGHGFNTCVGDAVNIAWKIAAVEQGWAPPDLLASYEPERRGVAEATVASAESNNRLLADVLPRDAAAIQRAKRAEFHSLGVVLGYSYAGSPVIQPGVRPAVDVTSYTPSAEPGARLPHHWLPDSSSLYDRLGRGFTLVGPVTSHAGAAADLVRRARHRRIPLTLAEAPGSYPWHDEFLPLREQVM